MVGKQITHTYTVEGQIDLTHVAQIASAGFKTLMCNRPDGEDDGQPHASEFRAAAEAEGLVFSFLPVFSGAITDQNIADFKAAYNDLPKPIFAYCRSGTRCTALWSLSEAQNENAVIDDILAKAARAGYDMQGLVPRMKQSFQTTNQQA